MGSDAYGALAGRGRGGFSHQWLRSVCGYKEAVRRAEESSSLADFKLTHYRASTPLYKTFAIEYKGITGFGSPGQRKAHPPKDNLQKSTRFYDMFVAAALDCPSP